MSRQYETVCFGHDALHVQPKEQQAFNELVGALSSDVNEADDELNFDHN